MRANLRAAAKVATVATLLIAVVYVGVASAIDAFAARRVLWEVDQRLSNRLSVVGSLRDPLSSKTLPDDVGTDGAPVFVWWVSPAGRVTPLTVASPPLPDAAVDSASTPLSVPVRSGATFRFSAVRFRGGLLIAAQDLAGPSHIDRALFAGELVLGPILVAAVFAGVLAIGLRAAAPAESARRRLQELTADASHELRTPLTVIEAEIELARSVPPDAAADREALDHVARESRRLKSIVEDLLWLARFDASPERPQSATVDIGAIAGAGAPPIRSRGVRPRHHPRDRRATGMGRGTARVDGPAGWHPHRQRLPVRAARRHRARELGRAWQQGLLHRRRRRPGSPEGPAGAPLRPLPPGDGRAGGARDSVSPSPTPSCARPAAVGASTTPRSAVRSSRCPGVGAPLPSTPTPISPLCGRPRLR